MHPIKASHLQHEPERAAAAAASRQYSTFFLDGLYLGVEVLKVQELIRYQEMTRVPLASSVVRGLINLRGQIVTAIELRRRFDMPDRPAGQMPMNVVVRLDDVAVSLLAVLVGIFGLVPFIGATLASILVVIAALFQSSTAAIIVLAYYIIYQQIEIRIFVCIKKFVY